MRKRPRRGLIGAGSRLVAILGKDPEDDNGEDYIQDSCGCVFCDLGLEPVNGEHIVKNGHTELCGLLRAPE